ncbi:MAG: FAD-linked oxidase C-terminal domain-containing protein [Polyangiales bacterium]
MNAADRAVTALRRALGPSVVDDTPETCEALSRDESDVAPTVAACVVAPTVAAQVVEALRLCEAHDVPVYPRGGGTGRTGGSVPLRRGVVLDTRALAGIHEIDRAGLLAVVGPGTLTASFQREVEGEGLFFPPDPLSAPWCTLGGNVAENAGGPRAFKYGVTRDWTLGMDAVLMGGERLAVGRRTAKGVTGYDLTATLVGSEGTLAVFTSLTLRLMVKPRHLRALAATFTDVVHAGEVVSALVARGLRARCVELIDGVCCEVMRTVEPGSVEADAGGMLIVEADGDSEGEVDRCIGEVATVCEAVPGARFRVAASSEAMAELWGARRVLSRALRGRARHKLSEDVVVPRGEVATLLRAVRGISERRGVLMPTYGHAGDGNLHVNLLWNDPGERPAVALAVEDLFRATLDLRGTLTGEHGIGVTKRDYLSWEQSDALIALQRRVKRAFDARGLLNPEKILPPSHGHRHC